VTKSYWKFELGMVNKSYWKHFWLGAAATFLFICIAGYTIEALTPKHGDVSGVLAEVWFYALVIAFVWAYIRRPKRRH
jgi:hypothetical protein